MLFAMGAAASAIDLLKSLTSSKTTGGAANASGFGQSVAASQSHARGSVAELRPQSGTLSPGTMSAMLDAQSDATMPASTPDASRSKALKHLMSLLDSDGDGQVSKGEFEAALGAGGTNTAAADNVFDKMDADGDGAISMSEMSSTLKSRHRSHPQSHGLQGSDALLQALDGMTDRAANGAAGNAATSYGFMERALQGQAQALARNAAPTLSVSV